MTVPVHGLPSLLCAGMRVAVVPPPLTRSRWRRVESLRSSGGPGEVVRLSGSSGIADAQELVGSSLLADVSDLPADLALHDADALLGRSVTDARHGELGTIAEVMVGPANDVWVIRGRLGELLVPVVDEVVSEVPARGPIEVRVPEGTIATEGV